MPSRLSARVLSLSLLASVLAACGQQEAPPTPPPPAVTVAKPQQQEVTDFDEYVGRVLAVESVEVRARVSGYLDKVHFQDGEMVKEGQPLFSIDPRPFQNAVAQARSNLAQARANLAFAEADLGRGQQLVRDKTITEQAFDQRTQAFKAAQATVDANEAAVKQAELDLTFTELKAPISGHIGDRRVSPGNLVSGGSAGGTTLLATIVSTDPIRFEFTIDEASYLRYQRILNRSGAAASRGKGLPIKLKLIDEKSFDHSGRIDFIDNVIDRSSGTIRGRALVDNPDGLFTPGMFARIQVPGSEPYQGLLVPDVAIGSEQARKFVYVVGADGTVGQKYVTLGQLVGGKMRVVKEGLAPDDRVIVNGMAHARPGIKVTPQEAGAQPQQGAAPPAGGGAPAPQK
jgi:RND family efflux transporter MFP subunit